MLGIRAVLKYCRKSKVIADKVLCLFQNGHVNVRVKSRMQPTFRHEVPPRIGGIDDHINIRMEIPDVIKRLLDELGDNLGCLNRLHKVLPVKIHLTQLDKRNQAKILSTPMMIMGADRLVVHFAVNQLAREGRGIKQ